MIKMSTTERERDIHPGSMPILPEGDRQRRQRINNLHSSLPLAGYLFKDKIDTTNIIDPNDMGLKVLQAQRKGKLELFHSPDKHMQQIQKMRQQMKGKKEG